LGARPIRHAGAELVVVSKKLSEFCALITAPSLRAIADHWLAVRGENAMPSWHDLKPQSLSRYLPIIWSYKYDRVGRAFAGRLAGDRIARLFGKNFRGIPLVEAHGSDTISIIHAALSRVVLGPQAHRGWGKVLKQEGQFGIGERIMLPLAGDGVHADEVFGATEYSFPQMTPGMPTMSISEHEEWYSLE
jgi:hypothetical protein